MPRTAKPLTLARVRAAKPRSSRYEITDGGRHGLELRVHPTGRKSWMFRYTGAAGERRRLVLGDFPDVDLKAARGLAAEAAQQVSAGGDPAVRKAAMRHTVDEMLGHYEAHHVPSQRDGKTTRGYIAKHLRRWDDERWAAYRAASPTPAELRAAKALDRTRARIGNLRIAAAQPEDFRPLIEAAPRGAQRKLLGILRVAFSYAERNGWRSPGTNPISLKTKKNPAGFFRPPPEEKHDRVLTIEEFNLLISDLDAASARRPRTRGYLAPHIVLAIRLVAETGARASEILNARWDDFDPSTRALRVVSHKTSHLHGAAPKSIVLSDAALDALVEAEGFGHGFICETSTGRPLTVDNLSRAWNRLADRLGFNTPGMTRRERATLHSLRHTVTHHALEAGVAPELVQQNLGHASLATTRRWYSNASAIERRQAAANAASNALRGSGGTD